MRLKVLIAVFILFLLFFIFIFQAGLSPSDFIQSFFQKVYNRTLNIQIDFPTFYLPGLLIRKDLSPYKDSQTPTYLPYMKAQSLWLGLNILFFVLSLRILWRLCFKDISLPRMFSLFLFIYPFTIQPFEATVLAGQIDIFLFFNNCLDYPVYLRKVCRPRISKKDVSGLSVS